jgi:hypothetical protein
MIQILCTIPDCSPYQRPTIQIYTAMHGQLHLVDFASISNPEPNLTIQHPSYRVRFIFRHWNPRPTRSAEILLVYELNNLLGRSIIILQSQTLPCLIRYLFHILQLGIHILRNICISLASALPQSTPFPWPKSKPHPKNQKGNA